jgi:hypothetical protein
MIGFRHSEERRSPEPRRITDVAVMRFDDVYEVDPSLMQDHVRQQPLANWDIHRIVGGRHDHLEWMHRHWSTTVVSGEELLRELEAE